MRHDRATVSTLLMGFLLSALVSFSCAMCMVEAFLLPCDPATLLACCCGGALVATAIMWPRRSWPFSLAAAAVYVLVLFWQREILSAALDALLYRITGEYALCFEDVRILGTAGGDPLWFLVAYTVPLAWLTAWVACREGSLVLVLLACLPVLLLCLIIVDIAPVFWLILLTFALLILLVSYNVRERSPAEGGRLAWWLVLPSVILVSAITVLWPPADYTRADWSSALQELAENKVGFDEFRKEVFAELPSWNRELEAVDLSQVGPKAMTGTNVLEYRSEESLQYLRGVSLGIYQENGWHAVSQSAYHARQFDGEPLTAPSGAGTQLQLSIQTQAREPLLYTPYYLDALPAEGDAVDDAYVQNTRRASAYTLTYQSGAPSYGAVPDGYQDYVYETYLQIPDDLLPHFSMIVNRDGLRGAAPQQVADYVRNQGVYDLNTPRVPEGKDFTLYFLNESRRGYCVHFASATVMLLRTIGIPARYVTGYSVSGPAGQWNQVTQNDAHAWVEYYADGVGWLPLDPTPAAEEAEPEPLPETDVQPEPTEPEPAEPDPAQPEPTEPEPAPADPQAPGTSPSAPAAPAFSLPPQLLWLLALPGLLLLLCLRRWMALRRRRDRCSSGHPNRRALTMWRWLELLARESHMELPESLLSLAEKARFSQHTLTEDELFRLHDTLEQHIQVLQAAPAGKRLWYKFGLTLF